MWNSSPATRVVVFPKVNAAHAAWDNHLENLRNGGIELIYGDHIWLLYAVEQ